MTFFQNYLGEFAALTTAVFWTVTALAFESASLKIGSLSVNIIRLFIAFFFLCIYNAIARGLPFPTDTGLENWLWLLLSGFIGFVFGDLFLFKSYTIIGSRFAMLFMTLAPPFAAILAWLFLNEQLTTKHIIGMIITITGISLAIFSRDSSAKKIKMKLVPIGVLLALGGAMGQAGGLVLSKIGMKDYDPFAATQIRIIAGIIGFSFLMTITGRWKNVIQALSHRSGMISTSIGSFFGPFLGVSFSLLAIKHTHTGIAATLMSIIPVLIIVPSVLLFKQKVTFLEIVGAIISIFGVAWFFI